VLALKVDAKSRSGGICLKNAVEAKKRLLFVFQSDQDQALRIYKNISEPNAPYLS
jgi:hypothetical protein